MSAVAHLAEMVSACPRAKLKQQCQLERILLLLPEVPAIFPEWRRFGGRARSIRCRFFRYPSGCRHACFRHQRLADFQQGGFRALAHDQRR